MYFMELINHNFIKLSKFTIFYKIMELNNNDAIERLNFYKIC